MAVTFLSRPKWLYTIGGIVVFVGIGLLGTSIYVKSVLLPSVKGGIDKMRFIDDLNEKDTCDVSVLGDLPCSDKRLKALTMLSKEKRDICMSSEAPESKAIASASRWCQEGDPGCIKPRVCEPGENMVFHFFSVKNPSEVLNGSTPELEEMEPIRITKTTDKVKVDTKTLESDGTISYREANRFTLTDPADFALLNQTVVIPNPAAWTVAHDREGGRASMDSGFYVIAAAVFYKVFEEKMAEMTAALPVRQWFTGRTGINLDTLVIDQFHSGSFSLALGELLASPACPLLVPLIAQGLQSTLPADVAIRMMCQEGFRNNIGFSVFSPLLKASKITLSPKDAPFFYEFEKGCADNSEKPSYVCRLDRMCPQAPGSVEHNACIKPTLDRAYVEELFNMFGVIRDSLKPGLRDTEKLTGGAKAINFLTSGCKVGNIVPPGPVCDLLKEQLLRIGRLAFTKNNPKWKAILAQNGWDTNEDFARKVYPYFIRAQIGTLMGFGMDKPIKDVNGYQLGLQMWVNSLKSDDSVTDFTDGPFTVAVSSKTGPVNRLVRTTVKGKALTQACTFDTGCLRKITLSSPEFCKDIPDVCKPEPLDGQMVGFIPPRKYGENEGLMDVQSLTDPDTLTKIEFTRSPEEKPWGQLKVHEWNMTNLNLALHNCDRDNKNLSRGIDCDSPKGTKNFGYHAAYRVYHPGIIYVPFYMSLPWFVNPAKNHMHAGAYDPMDRIKITKCKTCPEIRDFSSRLYTEPETGMHVFGSVKMQLNVRISNNMANLTKLGEPIPPMRSLKAAVPGEFDFLLPLFWVNKHNEAPAYQAVKLASLQSLGSTVNVMFGLMLSAGILLLAAGLCLIYRARVIQKKQQLLFGSRDSIKSIGETDRSTAALNSPENTPTPNQNLV